MSVTLVPYEYVDIRQQIQVTSLTEHNFELITTWSNNKRGRILTQNLQYSRMTMRHFPGVGG